MMSAVEVPGWQRPSRRCFRPCHPRASHVRLCSEQGRGVLNVCLCPSAHVLFLSLIYFCVPLYFFILHSVKHGWMTERPGGRVEERECLWSRPSAHLKTVINLLSRKFSGKKPSRRSFGDGDRTSHVFSQAFPYRW